VKAQGAFRKFIASADTWDVSEQSPLERHTGFLATTSILNANAATGADVAVKAGDYIQYKVTAINLWQPQITGLDANLIYTVVVAVAVVTTLVLSRKLDLCKCTPKTSPHNNRRKKQSRPQ
jgi:hypothetical protein